MNIKAVQGWSIINKSVKGSQSRSTIVSRRLENCALCSRAVISNVDWFFDYHNVTFDRTSFWNLEKVWISSFLQRLPHIYGLQQYGSSFPLYWSWRHASCLLSCQWWLRVVKGLPAEMHWGERGNRYIGKPFYWIWDYIQNWPFVARKA